MFTAVAIVIVPANHKKISGLTQIDLLEENSEQLSGGRGLERGSDFTAKGQETVPCHTAVLLFDCSGGYMCLSLRTLA